MQLIENSKVYIKMFEIFVKFDTIVIKTFIYAL